VSVYLPASTIRTLKLIAIDHDRRLNDLCAEAIQEWLERNGHARSTSVRHSL
jgi:CRISPR/Cas system-associated protein Csm6